MSWTRANKVSCTSVLNTINLSQEDFNPQSSSASELLAHYNHFQIILFSSEESRQGKQESRVWPMTSIRFSYQQKTINTQHHDGTYRWKFPVCASVIRHKGIVTRDICWGHTNQYSGESAETFIVSEINLLGWLGPVSCPEPLTAEC